MRVKIMMLGFCLTVILSTVSFAQNNSSDVSTGHSELRGPYLGQELPGTSPEPFAPGIIRSGGMPHSPLAISSDGMDIAWYRLADESSGDYQCKLFFCRQKDGVWPEPVSSPFKDDEYIEDLYFSGDSGNLICLGVKYNSATGEYTRRLYSFERTETGWGNPKLTESETPHESGCVSPDGECRVFPSDQPGREGWLDLYVSFKKPDGTWGEKVHLSDTINTDYNEHYPSFSPDGKYLFFVRGSRYYWVGAGVVEALKAGQSE